MAAPLQVNFEKRCHYTRQIFLCTHQKWLRQPKITHKAHCLQPETSRTRCRNMAEVPKEVFVNDVCKDCKPQQGGAAKREQEVKIAAASWKEEPKPPQRLENVTKKSEALPSASKAVEEKTKEVSKQRVVATATGKNQQSKSWPSKVTIVPAPVIQNEVKIRKPLIQLYCMKVYGEPDWDVITLGRVKDPYVERDDVKKGEKSKEGWVKIEKPEAGKDTTKDDEYSDWDFVNAEIAGYQQGVDGWELKRDAKGQCGVD